MASHTLSAFSTNHDNILQLSPSFEKEMKKHQGLSGADVLSMVFLSIPKTVNFFAKKTITIIDSIINPRLFNTSSKLFKVLLIIPQIILFVSLILPLVSSILLKKATQKLAQQFDAKQYKFRLSKMDIDQLNEEEKSIHDKPYETQCVFYNYRLVHEYDRMMGSLTGQDEPNKTLYLHHATYKIACCFIRLHDLRILMQSNNGLTRLGEQTNYRSLGKFGSAQDPKTFSFDLDGSLQANLESQSDEFFKAGIHELTSRLEDQINFPENSMERFFCEKMLEFCRNNLARRTSE